MSRINACEGTCKACLLPLASSATLLHISIHCNTRPPTLQSILQVHSSTHSTSTCTNTTVYIYVRVSLTSVSGQWEGTCTRLSYRGRGEQSVGVYVTVHPNAPPLFQIGLYYHASIFVEFENVRHYHMYSKVYSNTLAALSGYWRKPTP